MTPFEALTTEDKEIFINYIRDFGDAVPEVPIDYLLRFWNTNKVKLFAAFDNKLILEKQVKFRKSESELVNEWDNALCSNPNIFNIWEHIKKTFIKKAEELFPISPEEQEKEAIKTIWFPSYPSEYYQLSGFFSHKSEIISNIYKGSTFYVPTHDGKRIKVETGCRIMPTLRKLCHEFGIPDADYEAIRLFQSQITNNAYCYGTLCLSIAPIDYISMSDNGCDWDSCMCWVNHEGEYRQGTIEMMNSPYVVVAYLKSDTPYYPWAHGRNKEVGLSNKKWRQLLICNEDVIVGNRQYPYDSKELEETAMSWMRELLGADNYSSELSSFWNNTNKEDNPGGHNYQYDFSSNYMYNDIYNWRSIYFANNFFEKHPKFYSLNFSGPAECMQCGEEMGEGEDTSWVVCAACNGAIECDCCGSYIYDGDECYTNDLGEHFCESCVNESDSIRWCNCCNQPFFESDIVDITYQPTNSRWERYITSCKNCFPSLGDFGPADEDGIYHEENFTEEAENFIYNAN